MPLRQYDPAIARWTGIDPVTHHSMSTYTAFDNNPAFWADPSGADGEHYNWETERYEDGQGNEVSFDTALASVGANADGSPQDDITVNSNGIVTNIVENDKPNRFFDQDGNELFFNDPTGVDELYNNGQWTVGDRLYTPLSFNQVNQEIIDNGLIFQRFMAEYPPTPGSGPGYYLWSLFSARNKGHGDFDFAENFLINSAEEKILSQNTLVSRSRASYADDSGFFRFGNTNNIYNLYDAGNYMWGRAIGMSGFSYGEVRAGSQLNETFRDSEADQRAIKNGFNGN